MSLIRPQIVLFAVLLAIMSCQAIGPLHAGHDHGTSASPVNCPACALNQTPLLDGDRPEAVAAAAFVERAVILPQPLPPLRCGREQSSPRSPPSIDIA